MIKKYKRNSKKNVYSLPGEFWKVYNHHYLFSNKGRWYSIRTNKILKDRLNNCGYSRVMIDGKHVFTHIKVVQLFGDVNGNRLPADNRIFAQGLSIDHIDGNKQNNAVHNLELVTHRENCKRKVRK